MNLFRSEEHARRWSGERPFAESGLRPLGDYMTIFSAPLFRERTNGHYVSSLRSYFPEFMGTVRAVTGGDPFWHRDPP